MEHWLAAAAQDPRWQGLLTVLVIGVAAGLYTRSPLVVASVTAPVFYIMAYVFGETVTYRMQAGRGTGDVITEGYIGLFYVCAIASAFAIAYLVRRLAIWFWRAVVSSLRKLNQA